MEYSLVAENPFSTVLAEYVAEDRPAYGAGSYQSEAALEAELLAWLAKIGYTYLPITDEVGLVANLRTALEELNDMTFTDEEWARFFAASIAPKHEGIVEKTRRIQTDYVQVLRRDDGTTKNVKLIEKGDLLRNKLQVINQYVTEGNHANRYDVTLLVNGLPLIHIELKRRGVEIREAFNQIERYQRDSFWAGAGLFEYVQVFVISNGTSTKYYSNTTRDSHIREQSAAGRKRSKKTSNSFEFTSYWADARNHVIRDLRDFARTFLAPQTILSILTKYCVFTTEEVLMLMRPYQIAATERILSRVYTAVHNKKLLGTIDAGGYIWHTTGSGKTLTSFKTAQLASDMVGVDKVLFVVDRKDLDYQTVKEYDRFQKGAANGSANTKELEERLADKSAKIVVTTIQKLSNLVKKYRTHDIYSKHVVFIFDECHRSQFGDMHRDVVKKFKKYQLFGFTGTPIFAQNAGTIGAPDARTTPQLFGARLHTYTIVNAIGDGNVLPFRIDYIKTFDESEHIKDDQVKAIDMEAVLLDPARIELVTRYILEHFDQKTLRSKSYDLKGQRVLGFNSMFAVSSTKAARLYYDMFQKLLAETGRDLTVATIFSYAANENTQDFNDGVLPDEDFDTVSLDASSRDFLERVIGDYNARFQTAFSTDGDAFQNYYKDLSLRVKNREVDILIVVNMFLTGFDATTLNTLWVDKNLRYHGLIQAFSRTNRILNAVKTYGNIVCFRNLEKNTNDAISLFGDAEASSLVLMRTYQEYLTGYTDEKGKYHKGYLELVAKLVETFPVGEKIESEEAQKQFVKLFGNILRLRNILVAFDDFAVLEATSAPLTERDRQDYQSDYLDIYAKWRERDRPDKTRVNDDIVFELELLRQVEVNIDYILMLVEKYREKNGKDAEIKGAIDRAVGASPELRSKKELIDAFITRIHGGAVEGDTREAWHTFVAEAQEKALVDLIREENLKEDLTRDYIARILESGEVKTTGDDIDRLLPPTRRFGRKGDAAGKNDRAEKKATVIGKIKAFFAKFFGV